jgi:hypothetical protein
MSYHYDVEAAVASYRNSRGNVVIPDDAPAFGHIQHRNPEIAVEFLRMMLTELNKGSAINDILMGSASIMADFIMNFAMPYDEDGKAEVYHAFVHRISDLLSSDLSGDVRFIAGASATITGEEGGHA